jgi:hypothetical protein
VEIVWGLAAMKDFIVIQVLLILSIHASHCRIFFLAKAVAITM